MKLFSGDMESSEPPTPAGMNFLDLAEHGRPPLEQAFVTAYILSGPEPCRHAGESVICPTTCPSCAAATRPWPPGSARSASPCPPGLCRRAAQTSALSSCINAGREGASWPVGAFGRHSMSYHGKRSASTGAQNRPKRPGRTPHRMTTRLRGQRQSWNRPGSHLVGRLVPRAGRRGSGSRPHVPDGHGPPLGLLPACGIGRSRARHPGHPGTVARHRGRW